MAKRMVTLICRSIRLLPDCTMRALLVFAFGASGIAKIALPNSPSTIFGRIADEHPHWHVAAVVGEIALAVWILTGIKTAWGARIAALLLLVFIFVIVHELLSDHPSTCGCFSSLDVPNSVTDIRADLTWSLWRNILLLIAATWLSFARRPSFSNRQ